MKVTCHDIYHAFLCFATLGLIGRCIYLYFIDEDGTQVEFFKFYDPKSYFYPSISLCFTTIFTDSNNFDIYFTNKTDEELTSIQDNYFLILKNGTFLENPNQSRDLGSDLKRYLNIDYDKVTKDMKNYFHRFQARLKNGDSLTYKLVNGSFVLNAVTNKAIKDQLEKLDQLEKYSKNEKPTISISQRSHNRKCYEFSPPYIPNEPIESFVVYFHPTILSRKTSNKLLNLKSKQFTLSLHYPQQQIRALSADFGWTSKYSSEKSGFTNFYTRRYSIGNFETLKRRNKRTNRCIDQDYDKSINDFAIESVGCKNPANFSNIEAPFCTTKKSFNDFKEFVNDKDIVVPCNELQTFFCRIEEKAEVSVPIKLQEKFKDKGLIQIEIFFLGELYKQISYVKSFGFESMIGNGGGYVGKYVMNNSITI